MSTICTEAPSVWSFFSLNHCSWGRNSQFREKNTFIVAHDITFRYLRVSVMHLLTRRDSISTGHSYSLDRDEEGSNFICLSCKGWMHFVVIYYRANFGCQCLFFILGTQLTPMRWQERCNQLLWWSKNSCILWKFLSVQTCLVVFPDGLDHNLFQDGPCCAVNKWQPLGLILHSIIPQTFFCTPIQNKKYFCI